MREILFRGKAVCDDEWIEGSLVINKVDTPSSYYKTYRITDNTYGFSDEEGYEPDFMCGIDEEVDPTTIGQYTGLKDKNGKRIFEGDIIKSIYNNMTYVVRFGEYIHLTEYEEHECGFYCDGGNWSVEAIGKNVSGWGIKIGNIHDNPEFMKERTDNG